MRSRLTVILAMVTLFSLLTSLQVMRPAHGQLILVNLKVKIVKVERQFNRLQVRVHEGGNKDVQYVEIDGNTKFAYQNKEVSYNRAWNLFKPGMIIRVKGGYTMSVHVKAKTIYM